MSLTSEQQAHEAILRSKRILVVTKEHTATDGLAAIAACLAFLKKSGKPVEAVAPGVEPATIPAYLPLANEIKPRIGAMRAFHISLDVSRVPLSELLYDVRDNKLEIQAVPKSGEWSAADVSFKPGEDRYDLVIALDCPDIRSLGNLSRDHADFLYRTTIINIDCDPANEHWGQINLVDLNAVATTEILFRLFESWNRTLLDEDSATAILAGMIFKTNSFKTANVTPRTLAAASQLVGLGARREQIVQGIWRTRSVPTLKLWGRALTRLEYDREVGLSWITLTRNDFLETGLTPAAIEGLVDELVAYAPEAKAIAIMHESLESEKVCVSLHANPPLSASDLSRSFNATGNRSRANFCLEKGISLHDGVTMVVDRLRDTMKTTK